VSEIPNIELLRCGIETFERQAAEGLAAGQ